MWPRAAWARAQVVVICGRNEGLRRRLAESAWGGEVEVHAFGFVSNMHEFMAASDAIITKAGARPRLLLLLLLCPRSWARSACVSSKLFFNTV